MIDPADEIAADHDGGDGGDDDRPVEDPIAWLTAPAPGDGPCAVEIAEVWGEAILSARTYPADALPIGTVPGLIAWAGTRPVLTRSPAIRVVHRPDYVLIHADGRSWLVHEVAAPAEAPAGRRKWDRGLLAVLAAVVVGLVAVGLVVRFAPEVPGEPEEAAFRYLLWLVRLQR